MPKIAPIEELIKQVTGLDMSILGRKSLKRVLKMRMGALGIDDIDDYAALLTGSRSEFQLLINEVTVPETWFFRDSNPFTLLASCATELLSSARAGQVVRVLSVPCSTGEEAYSIAMTFLEAGFDSDHVLIDAVDISTQSLEKARRGVYGHNSFRGRENGYKGKYFSKVAGGSYAVINELKSMVRFSYDNVVSDEFYERPPYHIIFCRNMLIYFDLDTKARVLDGLHGLLKNGGLLFLGHAETGRINRDLFTAVSQSGTFAYKKQAKGHHKEEPLPISVSGERAVSGGATAGEETTVDKGSKAEVDIDKVLLEINGLADRGELEKAEQLCREFIATHQEVAEGYYLMGIIQLAKDDLMEGESCFRKALYLNPGHYQALVHMGNLAENRGDLSNARIYRRRARRLLENDPA